MNTSQNWVGVRQIINPWTSALSMGFACAGTVFFFCALIGGLLATRGGFAYFATVALMSGFVFAIPTFFIVIVCSFLAYKFGGKAVVTLETNGGTREEVGRAAMSGMLAGLFSSPASGSVSALMNSKVSPEKKELEEGRLYASDKGIGGFLAYSWKSIISVKKETDTQVALKVWHRFFGVPIGVGFIKIGFQSVADADRFVQAIQSK